MRNFQITRANTGTLETEVKVQNLLTLVCGEGLRQFDLLYAEVKNTETPLDVDYLLKGLSWYSLPVSSLSNQKHAMRCCTKNSCSLKTRRYDARLIDLNEYLASFPGVTMTDKMGVTK